VSEGYVDVAAGGRVWYRSDGGGPRPSLLVLHGGPGSASDSLHNLAALADERRVVIYDQLGSGRSDRPADRSLWVAERFVGEVGRVRDALGLDEVHLLGRSWGTALAAMYALTGAPGVRSLVFAGPYLSTPIWERDNARLLAAMPEEERTIREHLDSGFTSCPEYTAALLAFSKRHVCRLDPWPECVHRGIEGFGADVYATMWGPNDLMCTGNLKHLDLTGDVGRLRPPTLFLSGEHDQATPETLRFYQSCVPGAELVVLEGASHMVNVEREAETFAVVREFVGRHDGEAA
jgi:proline iminopeptidase